MMDRIVLPRLNLQWNYFRTLFEQEINFALFLAVEIIEIPSVRMKFLSKILSKSSLTSLRFWNNLVDSGFNKKLNSTSLYPFSDANLCTTEVLPTCLAPVRKRAFCEEQKCSFICDSILRVIILVNINNIDTLCPFFQGLLGAKCPFFQEIGCKVTTFF